MSAESRVEDLGKIADYLAQAGRTISSNIAIDAANIEGPGDVATLVAKKGALDEILATLIHLDERLAGHDG